MFDIGFSELLVIGVVALVVIGPEKLPRVARTVGHLMGRAQRYVADVKADIAREAEFDELRRMRDSVQSTASDIEQSVTREFNSVEASVTDPLSPPVDPTPAALEAVPPPVTPDRTDGKPS